MKENFIEEFKTYLIENERSDATIEKYTLAVRRLLAFLRDREISKASLLEYRKILEKRKKPQSVNGDISAINTWLSSINMDKFKLKLLRIQKKSFLPEDRELTEKEYKRLLKTAKECGNKRLYMIMQTLAATGIRVSELVFITVENVKRGQADIRMKGKCRVVILPKKLRPILLKHAKEEEIENGMIFRTRSGRPINRSNINREMKKICKKAKVDEKKVFPHNFRHLFARMFYAVEKNIAHLADILGHSSIETTRIYVAESVRSYEKVLEKMRLVI